jgi:hypothetical protein
LEKERRRQRCAAVLDKDNANVRLGDVLFASKGVSQLAFTFALELCRRERLL